MNKYSEIKKLFKEQENRENAIKMAAYMRNLFKFYGLQAPDRKAIYQDYIKTDQASGEIDWHFLNACYEDEHREFQYLVIDYLSAMKKKLTYEDIGRIYPYVKTKQWWDTIDGFDRIIGGIAFTDARVNELMLTWSTDEDLWIRRIAIDHQRCRKEKTNVELLETIILNNLGSREFFINKAIGWSLREYSKTNPDRVRAFIARHKDKMSSLSIREGSKYI